MTRSDQITVVIASANTGVARTLRMALRGTGVREIHIAETPAEALDSITVIEPHVIVIVVDAAEDDVGLALIRSIRMIRKSAVPIVAASSRRDLKTVKAVIDAGGNEYLVTPASGDAILKKITSAIRAGR